MRACERRLADEVVAAGDLRQGKEPSLLAMLTGTTLVELHRLRRSMALPAAGWNGGPRRAALRVGPPRASVRGG